MSTAKGSDRSGGLNRWHMSISQIRSEDVSIQDIDFFANPTFLDSLKDCNSFKLKFSSNELRWLPVGWHDENIWCLSDTQEDCPIWQSEFALTWRRSGVRISSSPFSDSLFVEISRSGCNLPDAAGGRWMTHFSCLLMRSLQIFTRRIDSDAYPPSPLQNARTLNIGLINWLF